ncbi:MAG TPA: ribosomal subunit interface protein, partial [Desulfovibrio sp.]|nr:ribosomal subunit interface protein [Desulfovibrio sp.]
LTFVEESGRRTPSIAEMDKYEPKPMSVDEAAMQMDSLNYDFLVFRNSETEGLNVIYRRKNGDIGLIDPGF